MSATRQANPVSHTGSGEDNSVNPFPKMLRESIDESGWKDTAIAAKIDVKPPYLSLMLSDEKPINSRHLGALPADVGAIFAKKNAERYGYLVVKPLDGPDAVKGVLGGLLTILSHK